MSKLFSILALITVLFLSPMSHADNQMTETFLNDLDYLHEVGGDIYCYWDLKKEMDGVDWDELYEEARSQMTSATTIKGYYTILRKMIAGVHDGHVNISMLKNQLSNPYYLPLRFKEVEGNKIVISAIKTGAFIDQPPFTLGDQVVAMNDIPIEDVITDWQQYMSGSTEQLRRFYTIKFMHNWPPYNEPPMSNSILTIKDGGTTRKVEVPWIIYDYNDDPTYKMEEYRINEDVEAKILPGNIGYLRVSAMYAPVDEKYIPYIRSQMEKLLNTDGLIIDVRNNGGGWGEVGDAIISYLIDEPKIRYKASPRMSPQLLYARPHFYSAFEADFENDPLFAKWKDFIIEPAPKELRYKGEVITLINSKCFSACDTFADSIASNKLSKMMGTPTGGGTGYPMYIEMPSGMSVARFSTTRGYSNFGRLLEGTGTIPDIYARLTNDDIRNRRDSVLMSAYEMLLGDNQLTKSHSLKNAVTYSYSGKKELVFFPLADEEILPQNIEEERLINLSSHEFDELW
ncbi:MAG: hypothetical protein HN337_04945 [Deltaproteobacteria bacterium]|jgi:carboxyl-terminal processing protease|nr:hypothetical protein [Deltaproteobacteria bacterium]